MTAKTDSPMNARTAVLLPREVAKLFRVDPKTVARWEKMGKIQAIRPGGHRRYLATSVYSLFIDLYGPTFDGPAPTIDEWLADVVGTRNAA